MFRLSRGAEYAVRGILYLAMKPMGKISYVEEIATAQDVPRAYLAKIFQTLGKKGFVKSLRGPGGGFSLTRGPEEITLRDIIEAMEGPMFLNSCLIHVGYCDRDEKCPIHDVWREVQDKFMGLLSDCTFAALAESGRLKEKLAGQASGETPGEPTPLDSIAKTPVNNENNP